MKTQYSNIINKWSSYMLIHISEADFFFFFKFYCSEMLQENWSYNIRRERIFSQHQKEKTAVLYAHTSIWATVYFVYIHNLSAKTTFSHGILPFWEKWGSQSWAVWLVGWFLWWEIVFCKNLCKRWWRYNNKYGTAIMEWHP